MAKYHYLAKYVGIYYSLWNYLGIYHFFKTWVCKTRVCRVTQAPWKVVTFYVTQVPLKIVWQTCWLFFKKLEFLKLKLHCKLKFHKLEFQKSNTFTYIFKTMVNPCIFCQIMVFGHFGLANTSFQLFFIYYGLSAYFKFMLPLFLILYFDTKSSQFFIWTIFLSNHFFFHEHCDTRRPLS